MNSFNIKRFGKTLRWVLSVNCRTLLMWSVGVALVTFMGEMLLLKVDNHLHSPYAMVGEFAAFGGVILTVLTLIMISTITTSINEKRKRATFLMLPSSQLEKFLSLIAYTTLISMACVLLALIVGDSLRMLWFWIAGQHNGSIKMTIEETGETYYWWSSALPRLIGNIMPIALSEKFDASLLYQVMSLSLVASLLLWIHSVYTLGGTLVRKYSFAISTVVWILWVAFVKTMHHFGSLSLFRSEWVGDHYVGQEVGEMAYVLTAVLLIFACFNYWASFHIFKGFQIITNKWTNYDILKR